jgi:hypothetical protein
MSNRTGASPGAWCLELLVSPLRDYLRALDACLTKGSAAYIGIILLSCGVSWWLYVPIHELLHAFGCIVAGGKVSRLDISGIYGASLLKHFFPFVSVGSEYSGRLAGFDTGGKDFIYFVTDFSPYLLTIFMGVPLLKTVPSVNASPLIKTVQCGVAMPLAYAPFISLTGDYYEMGSLIVSRTASRFFMTGPERWRSDDLVKLVKELYSSQTPSSLLDIAVVSASFLVGIGLIFTTYWLGAVWTHILMKKSRR